MPKGIDSQSQRDRLLAAVLTVALAGVIVTPLCGALFGCGCTWPWAGLDRHCNVHDPSDPAHCPWCVRPAVAALTFVAAASLGASAAWALPRGRLRRWHALLARTGVGLLVHALASTVGAAWIAHAAGYPHFLGG
ncbi:MAG: hypothetical protein U0610_14155 [bacterium]